MHVSGGTSTYMCICVLGYSICVLRVKPHFISLLCGKMYYFTVCRFFFFVATFDTSELLGCFSSLWRNRHCMREAFSLPSLLLPSSNLSSESPPYRPPSSHLLTSFSPLLHIPLHCPLSCSVSSGIFCRASQRMGIEMTSGLSLP